MVGAVPIVVIASHPNVAADPLTDTAR